MSSASDVELSRLYSSAHEWLIGNGDGHPASGVEPQLGPNGLPVVTDNAYYTVELTGNEVWGIAPEAARTLRVDGTEGSLNMAAFEEANERQSNKELRFAPPGVMFTVEFPPDGCLRLEAWLLG